MKISPLTLALLSAFLISSGCDKNTPGPAAGATAAESLSAARTAFPGLLPEGAELTTLLKNHKKDIDSLEEGMRSAPCGFDIDYSPGLQTALPHLTETRAISRVLIADAQRLLDAGDADGAARRVATVIRIATHVTCKAQSLIELLVGLAEIDLAADFIKNHPAVAQAAWKTDIQQALAAAQQPDLANANAIIRADFQSLVRSLRENKMVAMGGTKDWTTASQSDRDAAASHIAPLIDEYLRVWKLPDATASAAALDAITSRESGKPGGELLPPLGKARAAFEKVRKSTQEMSATLSK